MTILRKIKNLPIQVILYYFVLYPFITFTQNPTHYNSKSIHADNQVENEIDEIKELFYIDPELAREKINNKILLLQKEKQHKQNHFLKRLYFLKIDLNWQLNESSELKLNLFGIDKNFISKLSKKEKLLFEFYKLCNNFANGYYDNFESKMNELESQAHKINFSDLVGRCLIQKAKYFNKVIMDYPKTLKLLYQSKKTFISCGDSLTFLLADLRVVATLVRSKKYDEAITYSKPTITRAQQKKYYRLLSNLYVNTGSAYLGKSDYQEAKKYYDLCFKLNTIKNQPFYDIDVETALHGIGDIFSVTKQADSAQYYYHMLIHYNSDRQKNQNDKIAFRIEQSFLESQNNQLLQQKESEIKFVKNKNKLISTFVLFSLLFLAIIFSIITYAFRTKNRLNRMLVIQQKSILKKNELIDAALTEKVILLKEIHHRVKNNLQIISSLLNLQTKNIDDPIALNVLEEGKERIQAIALIHQKLYQTDSFTNIDMQDYIVDLINQLKRTYTLKDQAIHTNIFAHSISLNLDTAVPIGLIICELVTNALKHGFQDQQSGNLEVKITKTDTSDSYNLIVKDSGSGFDIHTNKVGLGTEIISALTEQLDGTFLLNSSNEGTTIELNFIKQN